ncbi:MAG: GNAT family N-acetyltransferase [Rhizobiales bacterium]|nr:GNAT family N-acetyltransferase [Hyphomicrobiales bacterium]
MQITLRPALPVDAPTIAHIFLSARAGMTYLPRLHSDDETRRFITHVVATQAVMLAEVTLGSRKIIAGFAAYAKNDGIFWLNHLYVRPDAQDFGAGHLLLDHVKTQGPHGFRLWCFQANEGARRFYERHGLVLAEMTDGSDNEEKLPDALYVWQG